MTRKKTYECMLLLDNREVKKGWDALKEQIDGVLTKYGAKIVVAKRWDERKLAFEIKKQRRATYYLSYLEADPASLDELERTLRLTAPVLRHLVLACEEIPGEAYEPEREFDLDRDEDKPDDGDSEEEPTGDELEEEFQPVGDAISDDDSDED
ncbi:MAG: 30S ribosomal protein S6 [Planctomycetes bacterium]|nr:30S ribosomal protein S6 [Planctomycetota bacterium]MCB9916897.1 30S ribosomal protein S6 [Planctomycetota bacterium]